MPESDMMGQNGFHWFIGVCEDRDDPLKMGRIKVRCLGIHTDDLDKLPTEDLPGSYVMAPTTSSSMQGLGETPHFIVQGAWVVVFFKDGDESQQPIIMGTLPGVPEDLGNPNTGFNDPNRRDDDSSKPGYNISIYPREEDVPDVNRLARTIGQEEQNKTILRSKRARVVNCVRSASGETWDEPPNWATRTGGPDWIGYRSAHHARPERGIVKRQVFARESASRDGRRGQTRA